MRRRRSAFWQGFLDVLSLRHLLEAVALSSVSYRRKHREIDWGLPEGKEHW